MTSRLTPAVLAMVCAALAFVPASAQSSASIEITALNTANFPTVEAFVAVSDSLGNRVPNLPQTSFQLIENNSAAPIVEFSEEERGLQLIFVIESSSVFSKRDPQALSRLDYVKTAIIDFAVGNENLEPYMKDGVDDVTLIVPEGQLLNHSTIGGEIRNALITYQSDFLFETGLFNLIRRGLNEVITPANRPGLRRVIVVFSSGIDASADAEVSGIAARANGDNITFHTVMVGPPGADSAPAAENLKELADITGGSFRYFDTPDSMTSLWDTLVTQRTQYRMVYQSRVAQSGQHTVQAVVVDENGGSITSSPSIFSVTVQPPSVTLVSPPVDIIRTAPNPNVDLRSVEPLAYELQVDIKFPDGYSRSIPKLQLVVDGSVASETTTGMMDSIAWDVSRYTQSGMHGVQVIATDELGLEGRSSIANVWVIIETPPAISTVIGPALVTMLIIGIAGVAVSALVVAVVVLVRRPAVITNIVREAGQRMRDSTEPYVPTPGNVRGGQRGKAYLEVIDSTDNLPRDLIELIGDNLRLGRDDSLAQIVLPDRSVSRLHARISEESDGIFFIHDEGSTSGTWVNYNAVPVTGTQLLNGDLINLGRVQLRFMLRQLQPVNVPYAHTVMPAAQAPAESNATEPFDPAHVSPPAPSTPPVDDYRTEAFTLEAQKKPVARPPDEDETAE